MNPELLTAVRAAIADFESTLDARQSTGTSLVWANEKLKTAQDAVAAAKTADDAAAAANAASIAKLFDALSAIKPAA